MVKKKDEEVAKFEPDTSKESSTINLDIGQAVALLKEGKKVRRNGWNGKGMWLVYMPPFRVETPNERTQAHGVEGSFDCGGYVVMWTATGVWQPGWLCSQADLLANDWELVD